MITLPEKVENKISEILNREDASKWTSSAIKLSSIYREYYAKRPGNIDFVRDFNDVLGYLALRVNSTYAQTYGSLSQVKDLIPNFNPKSLLDIGSGPGTSIWAAFEIWPSIKKIASIEKNKQFIGIGKEIISEVFRNDIKVDFKQADLTKFLPRSGKNYDLVILGNILNELDEIEREKVVEFALNNCKGFLLIVEPGTPSGFEIIVEAAKSLQLSNTHLMAPFINNFLITSTKKWIHFNQKIKRPDFQKRVRQKQRKLEKSNTGRVLPPSDFEDAKYCYIIFSKFPPKVSIWARVIEKPKIYKPFIEVNLLTAQGMQTVKVLKKDKKRYKFAKKLDWGDVIYKSSEIL